MRSRAKQQAEPSDTSTTEKTPAGAGVEVEAA